MAKKMEFPVGNGKESSQQGLGNEGHAWEKHSIIIQADCTLQQMER